MREGGLLKSHLGLKQFEALEQERNSSGVAAGRARALSLRRLAALPQVARRRLCALIRCWLRKKEKNQNQTQPPSNPAAAASRGRTSRGLPQLPPKLCRGELNPWSGSARRQESNAAAGRAFSLIDFFSPLPLYFIPPPAAFAFIFRATRASDGRLLPSLKHPGALRPPVAEAGEGAWSGGRPGRPLGRGRRRRRAGCCRLGSRCRGVEGGRGGGGGGGGKRRRSLSLSLPLADVQPGSTFPQRRRAAGTRLGRGALAAAGSAKVSPRRLTEAGGRRLPPRQLVSCEGGRQPPSPGATLRSAATSRGRRSPAASPRGAPRSINMLGWRVALWLAGWTACARELPPDYDYPYGLSEEDPAEGIDYKDPCKAGKWDAPPARSSPAAPLGGRGGQQVDWDLGTLLCRSHKAAAGDGPARSRRLPRSVRDAVPRSPSRAAPRPLAVPGRRESRGVSPAPRNPGCCSHVLGAATT